MTEQEAAGGYRLDRNREEKAYLNKAQLAVRGIL